REERGAERHEQVGADSRLAVTELALDADRRAEGTGNREPEERLPAAERRDASQQELQWPPPGSAAGPRSRPPRGRAARRVARGRTGLSRRWTAPRRTARRVS